MVQLILHGQFGWFTQTKAFKKEVGLDRERPRFGGDGKQL